MIWYQLARMGKRVRKTTYETSAAASNVNSQRGFTLVELLLVCGLLVLLASVVFPRLNTSLDTGRLREGADMLASFIRFARHESVNRGLPVALTATEDSTRFSLSLVDPDNHATDAHGSFADPFLDEDKELPFGVTLGKLIRNGERAPLRTIIFQPTGVSEPMEIELVDRQKRRARVSIGPWLDDVRSDLVSSTGGP
jgi:type II secretion system protein H